MDMVARAREIADDLLQPAAAAVDAADRVPETHFDQLESAGLYQVADLDRATLGPVVAELASGCLATAFVWIQHTATRRRGGGIARSAARPSGLVVRPAGRDYELTGEVPWVTGWGILDVLQVAAYDPDDDTVKFFLLDAAASASLSATRLELSAANASCTVMLSFESHFVEAERFTHALPLAEWQRGEAPGSALNGFLALGVASRCLRLMGAAPSLELDRCRDSLLAADADSTPAARAAASAYAVRCAAALAVFDGSRSALRGSAAARLSREASFLLVFGTRPLIRSALLARLAP